MTPTIHHLSLCRAENKLIVFMHLHFGRCPHGQETALATARLGTCLHYAANSSKKELAAEPEEG